MCTLEYYIQKYVLIISFFSIAIFIGSRWINYNEALVFFSNIYKKQVLKLNRNNIATIANN